MPEPKKPVPHEQARELVDAARGRTEAQARWERAVHEALKAGASLRECAALAGVSHGTIEQLAKKVGWPDAAEKARRAHEAAKRAAWREAMGQLPDAPRDRAPD